MCLRASATWQNRPLGLFLLLLVVATGCEQDEVVVRSEQGNSSYGRKDLLDAVDRFARSERSPQRFRDLALTIRTLSPRFDRSMASEAERNLVMMALGPLRTRFQEPLDAQLDALATTVWPTALGIDPTPGEAPAAYAERICREALALECKQVVPEHRALVLSALVWTRLAERARDIVQTCKACRESEGFREAVRDYERFAREISMRKRNAEDEARPGRWPHAGDRAVPWPNGMPVVVVRPEGQATLDGQPIAPGAWPSELGQARKRSGVLGIHMAPSARVRDLRAILADAAQAGFGLVALQARATEYPYALVEYRVATGRKRDSRLVRVRDVDTIQVLVQALDALAAEDGLPPRI
jgi:hypothetical protein